MDLLIFVLKELLEKTRLDINNMVRIEIKDILTKKLALKAVFKKIKSIKK